MANEAVNVPGLFAAVMQSELEATRDKAGRLFRCAACSQKARQHSTSAALAGLRVATRYPLLLLQGEVPT